MIRRATELQFEDHLPAPAGELLREEDVLRVGADVGLDAQHLRRALGELRAESLRPHPPLDRGPWRALIGEGYVRVSRHVPGQASEVDERLAGHLEVGESLTRIRKRGDVSLWEPQGGFVAGLQRAVGWRGFSYRLARAASVELAVSRFDEGHALVTMVADVRKLRAVAGGGWIGGVSAGGLAVAGVTGAILSLPAAAFPLLLLPGALGGAALGRLGARSQLRQERDRIRLVMEGILDRLESGEPLARRGDLPWRSRRPG